MNKIAFVYPGTGSQYKGMFKPYYDQYAIVRETFEEAGEAAGMDLARLCFEDGFPEDGSIARAQVAILACGVAGHRLLVQETGLQPAMAAGHSLGEWTALASSGAIGLAEASRLVKLRGEAMESAVPSGGGRMIAVARLPKEKIAELCASFCREGQIVEIACLNGAHQTVVAGHREAVDKCAEALEAAGGKLVRLQSEVPFHTSLMRPAAEKLKVALAALPFANFHWPVISNVTARPHGADSEETKHLLAEQLTVYVRWEETIRYMQIEGISHVAELGPQKVLKQLNGRTARNIRAYSLDVPEDATTLFAWKIPDTAFIDRCLAIAVSTRNRNEDIAAYREGAMASYRKLLALKERITAAGARMSDADKEESLALLHDILESKRADEEEIDGRVAELASQHYVGGKRS